MENWHDPASGRDIWLATGLALPAPLPWSCADFGLLVLAERLVDLAPLANAATQQGLAVISLWGPASAVLEDAFDQAAADHQADIVCSSHPYETVEEAIETFLALTPPKTRANACRAWCILAMNPALAQEARRSLTRRPH